MSTSRFSRWATPVILVAVTGAGNACGPQDPTPPPTGAELTGAGGASAGGAGAGGDSTGGVTYYTGGSTGSGSQPATGGSGTGSSTSTGGTGGTGGSGGSSAYTFVGTVTPAPGATVIAIPATFPSCAKDSCEAAHCAPTELVPEEQRALLGACEDGKSLCVPDDFIATFGKFELKTCASVEGIEGRCVSKCVPEVNRLSYALPQDTCDETELCAPCYYPWATPAGEEQTGACIAGQGDSPEDPQVLFDTCGAGRGLCVPGDLVPANLQPALSAETCTGAGQLCAPTEKVKDLTYKFPSCDPQWAILPPDPNQAGACVPKYIVDYYTATKNPLASGMTQSNCATGDICAPCVDPILGTATLACE